MVGQCAVFLFLDDNWACSMNSGSYVDAQGMASQPSLDDDWFAHESASSRHRGWQVDCEVTPSLGDLPWTLEVSALFLYGSSMLAYTLCTIQGLGAQWDADNLGCCYPWLMPGHALW